MKRLEALAIRKEAKAGGSPINQKSIRSYLIQGRGGEEETMAVKPINSLLEGICSYGAKLGVWKVGKKEGTSRLSNTNPDTVERKQLGQVKGRQLDNNPLER